MAEAKVAVLMDYENVYWSLKRQYSQPVEPGRLIEALRELGTGYGTVCLMQAYADFDNPEFHGLLSELQRRSVEPRHVFSKNYEDGTRKNAADIEMSLDALELMYNRDDVGVFMLVSGDRDMIQVIRKLRARGKPVYVVAVERAMSKDLTSFANDFTTVEELLGIVPGAATAAMAGVEPMLRRLHDMELAMPFVGLKYFMKVLSGGEQADSRIYEMVNRAIADDLIHTYQVPNPYDERFPTTACKVNIQQPAARQALGLPAVGTTPAASATTATPARVPYTSPAAAPPLVHSVATASAPHSVAAPPVAAAEVEELSS